MIITLKNETLTAAIDTLGAQLISMKDISGKEYIWQRDPAVWQNCSPLLFPAVGNSRNGKTIFDGQWYEMPKHGFCKNMEFTVTDQTTAYACFCLQDTPETKTMYPYRFRLSLSYTLTAGGIHMEYQVENPEDRDIHYCLGAHPGFIIPLQEHEQFNDYQLEFQQEETASCTVYDEKQMQFDVNHQIPLLNHTKVLGLNYQLFEHDAVFFTDIKSRVVSIIHPVTKKGIQVDYSGFETVAFWTPYEKKAPFLCVEPWNGSAICSNEDDEFIHKNHVQTLGARESRSYHLGIQIL